MIAKRIQFSVPGVPTTNNKSTRIYHGIAVHNPEATDYEQRIQRIAREAVASQGWQCLTNTEAAAMTIVCWNLAGDIDGRTKIAFDAIQNIIYENDKIIKRLLIIEQVDWSGPRIQFRIRAIKPLSRPPQERKMTFKDLNFEDYKAIAKNKDLILDPMPGVIKPMVASEMPESWYKKVTNALRANL